MASHGRVSPAHAAVAWPPEDTWDAVSIPHRRGVDGVNSERRICRTCRSRPPSGDGSASPLAEQALRSYQAGQRRWATTLRVRLGIGARGHSLPDVFQGALVFGVGGVGGGEPLGDGRKRSRRADRTWTRSPLLRCTGHEGEEARCARRHQNRYGEGSGRTYAGASQRPPQRHRSPRRTTC